MLGRFIFVEPAAELQKNSDRLVRLFGQAVNGSLAVIGKPNLKLKRDENVEQLEDKPMSVLTQWIFIAEVFEKVNLFCYLTAVFVTTTVILFIFNFYSDGHNDN